MSNKFEFILFDLIGTTVKDSGLGDSLVAINFSKAFLNNGLEVSYQEINLQRGKSKKEAIGNILVDHQANLSLKDFIFDDFMELLNSSLDGLTEIEDAATIFKILKGNGIKIGLGSGLPMEFIVKLISKVGWQKDSFDFIGSSTDLGKGRPDPIMINTAIKKLKLIDKNRILKIGDTIVDIQEGKNAGVKTASVLTGTQSKTELEKFNPDYIFSDIRELIKIL